MRRPKTIYLLKSEVFDRIYGPAEQQDIGELTDIYAPPQTARSIRENMSILNEAEAIFSGWGAPRLDREFLDAAPRLEIVFYGAGAVGGVVTEEFFDRGVRITSAYAANAVPVAEFTVSAIVLSLKHAWHYISAIKSHKRYPQRWSVPGCYGSTVGLVSLGTIGRTVLRMLESYDLNVIAYDPCVWKQQADDSAGAGMNVELVGLEELFRRSDVVSVHAPLLDKTRGMITGEHIASMKRGASLINTARGAVIRQDELTRAAQRRSDLQFVLDVTSPEPPREGSALYELPNVILTPHIAGSQFAECRRMGRYMVDELKRYLADEDLKWEITRSGAQNTTHQPRD